jgi:hypothetical protein
LRDGQLEGGAVGVSDEVGVGEDDGGGVVVTGGGVVESPAAAWSASWTSSARSRCAGTRACSR